MARKTSGPRMSANESLRSLASQSSNYMRIYTNGNLFASKSGMTPFIRGHYELRIGGGGVNYFNYNGRLDEFRVWKTALSQAQIQANLGAPLAGNEAGLLLQRRPSARSGRSENIG